MTIHLIDIVNAKLSNIKSEITTIMQNMLNARKRSLIIWAEQNGLLTADRLDYSFGNGSDNNSSFGIIIPFSCEITHASLCAITSSGAAGEIIISILINGSETSQADYIIKPGGNISTYKNYQSSIQVPQGAVINFKSKSTNSSVTHSIVSIVLEY